VKVAYERLAAPRDLLRRARELSVRTMILDVEPLVAYWDSGQEALDAGIAQVLGDVAGAPELRVVCFSTNSARRPSAPVGPAGHPRVVYLASARKPLRTAPYRDFPRPGAVLGDQVATDGVLARRLGYAFLHYCPELADAPAGPRLLHDLARPLEQLLFTRPR
jgi:hypothetical protein